MNKLLIGIALILLAASAWAQDDSTYTPPATGSDEVDLSGRTIEIKIEPDRPRVTIYSERIKPEFDTVDLEKSFRLELVGKGERMEVADMSENDQTTLTEEIDVNKALSKPRNQQ